MATHPTEPGERAAAPLIASAFLAKLKDRYDVAEAIVFGSRARGDHHPDSDLDLAVVLKGERRDFIDTKLDMAGIAFDVMLETGVLVQAFPMWDGDLAHPERFTNPVLVRTIAEEGIRCFNAILLQNRPLARPLRLQPPRFMHHGKAEKTPVDSLPRS